MKKVFWRKLINSSDGEVEAHLLLMIVGASAFVALSIYQVVILRNAFDADVYGRGLGTLFAGGGAAAWGQGLQRKAEKGGDDESNQ